MGQLTVSGWSVDSASVHTLAIRDAWDAELGVGDYTQTIEGAVSLGGGVLAFGVDQGVQLVVDALDPRGASGVFGDVYAAQVGVRRRPATASAYVVRATVASGSYVLPAGTVLLGGGSDGLATWTTDADTTIGTTDTLVDVTCQQTGAIVFSGVTSLRVVTPQSVTVTIGYDPGDADPYTVGRVRESNAQLEVRRSRSLVAVPAPTRDGIRAGLLALTWVQAASVERVAPGVIRCTVYPGPATAAQEREVVDTIGFRAVSTTISAGSAGSGTYTLADGSTETVYWHEGGDQSVAVVVVLVLVTGWTLAEVKPAVTDAITAEFDRLDIGGTIAYSRVYAAIALVEGVQRVSTLTLDAAALDVTALSSTDFLVPSISIT